ncbi:MAG TPA: DUF3999 family protein [Steroidobacteraceae bacterium]|nr:DUF3999 family protein [Steroidobacteraceae bacterium]
MLPGLALMLSSTAVAVELRPQDFAYGMTVSTTEEAPAYRVSLPLVVYQQAVHEDLGDLRIFNARGDSLPYAIRRPDPAVIAAGAPRALPLFPLHGDPQAAAANVRITIDSPSLALKLQNPPGAGSKAASSYIVDGRTLDVPLAAIRVLWPADAPGYSGRLAVEASEDLAAWHTVAAAAPITNLHAGEQQLIENRVLLQAAQAKFWRLSFIGPSPTFELTQVLAEAADRRAEAAWLSLTVAGTAVLAAADGQQPGDVQFDLGARLPVERLDLELPDANSVAVVELLSRGRPTEPWHSVTRSSFFRLKTATGEQRNDPVSIRLNEDRYWLARGVPGGAASAAPPAQLQVTWNPSDIEFLAQGPPPFTLAYGNAAARRAETDFSPIPAAVKIARAEFAAPRVLGGPERRLRGPEPFPWQRALLWAALTLAVAGLAWMAYRVSKDGKPGRSRNTGG